MVRGVWISLIVLVTMGLGWSFVQGNADAPRRKKDDKQPALMRAKFACSQKIAEGLVSKDFEAIQRGGEEMLTICKATEWEAHSDPVYGHYRKELMLQAEKMIEAATRSNLDGATYSYIHGLTTCISCHEYCRDILKIAERPAQHRVVPIPTTAEDNDMPMPAGTVRR